MHSQRPHDNIIIAEVNWDAEGWRLEAISPAIVHPKNWGCIMMYLRMPISPQKLRTLDIAHFLRFSAQFRVSPIFNGSTGRGSKVRV
jgi:hypothetical protein